MNTPGSAESARRLAAAAAAAIGLHALAAYGLLKNVNPRPSDLSPRALSIRLVDTPVHAAPKLETKPPTPPQQRPQRPRPPEKPSPRPAHTPAAPTHTPLPPSQDFTPPAAASHPDSAPELPADPPTQANADRPTAESAAAQATRENSAGAPAIVCPGYQEALAEHRPPRALLRSGQGGEVLVEFTVMRDGTVQDVHVVSSTNPRLNHWATSGVSRKLRCAPQPQPVKLRLPIRLRFD